MLPSSGQTESCSNKNKVSIGKDPDAGKDWGQEEKGWDGWMASPTQWTWVWVNSGSWWWTGRPGVLQFMGSQRVGHDWATELTLKITNTMFKTWTQSYFEVDKHFYHKEGFYNKSENSESEGRSVVSDSLRSHGLYSPWNSSGQNIGMGNISLLQGNLPDPGIEPRYPALQADSLPTDPQGKPFIIKKDLKTTTWGPKVTHGLFLYGPQAKTVACKNLRKKKNYNTPCKWIFFSSGYIITKSYILNPKSIYDDMLVTLNLNYLMLKVELHFLIFKNVLSKNLSTLSVQALF